MQTTSEHILEVPNLASLHDEICQCQRCPLFLSRTNPVPGEGLVGAVAMFIGEAPGKVNDATGRPFVGHGGKIFDSILLRVGLSREEVFITNSVKCWPPNNRRPQAAEISTCKIFLATQIALVQPRLIVTLGGVAFKALTGYDIKLQVEHGRLFNYSGTPVCPTYHPNGIRYIRGGMSTITSDVGGCLKLLGISRPAMQAELFNGES